jgi:hypothetical protein
MIKYALQCEKGHSFESWFPDSAGYDQQRKRGLVDCPVCGSHKIEKQIMAPNVRVKDGGIRPLVAPVQEASPETTAVVSDGPLGEEARKFRAMLKEFHEHVKANTEDVGSKFADEARKIHYGEVAERAIRGQASAEEARDLHDEGIGFLPLPPLPDDRN